MSTCPGEATEARARARAELRGIGSCSATSSMASTSPQSDDWRGEASLSRDGSRQFREGSIWILKLFVVRLLRILC
ncbi:hypothetical protein Syun_008629 [Stephania yunnanensis]|uniref:Uncharacterized protein n=1 Tax=Stephania yunnanensis TaxID=152371 RepID=A0AAP0KE58_9MAGN